MEWQLHVYGAADADVTAWCKTHQLPLHIFPWQEAHRAAGLARDALYLLRPDSYVALAEARSSAQALDRYFAEQGIRLD
jgi:hypothetical protein